MRQQSKSALAHGPRTKSIPLTQLETSPEFSREYNDPVKLDQLGENMESEGQINPITVRPIKGGKKYQVLIGGRRVEATKRRADAQEIEARILDVDDEKGMLLRLSDKATRASLSEIDKGRIVDRLKREFGWSLRDVAEKSKLEFTSLCRARKMYLELPPQARQWVLQGDLKPSTAYAICMLPEEKRLAAARMAVLKGLTCSETKDLAHPERKPADNSRSIVVWTHELSRVCKTWVQAPPGSSKRVIRQILLSALVELENCGLEE